MTTEKRQRREYTEDFKRDAVGLVVEQDYSIAAAARSLDITAGLLGRWKRELSAGSAGKTLGQDEREELLQLRKEVRMLRMEKDILKKASQFFAKEMK
jgi:transposase